MNITNLQFVCLLFSYFSFIRRITITLCYVGLLDLDLIGLDWIGLDGIIAVIRIRGALLNVFVLATADESIINFIISNIF